MYIKEKIRKYILLFIVALIFIGLFTAYIMATKQDDQFAAEDFLYQQAIQLHQEGNYTQAQGIISDLIEGNSGSEMINYLAGLNLASLGEYPSAAVYMQKALDINPYNVHEPMFMLQFGEILFSAEQYRDALIVLQHCKDLNWNPEEYPDYQNQVQAMLTQIEIIE